jgi:hypothetical protein
MDTNMFINWVGKYCPNLYVRCLIITMSLQYTEEDVIRLFDDLQSQGFMACLNWELIAAGRYSLN